MICIAFVVKKIFVEFVFRIVSNLFFVKVLIILLNFLEIVAFPMILMVFFPVTHTNPTELILTSSTSHVITTSIFLYAIVTFRTLLSVLKNPFSTFLFLLLLFNPKLSNVTQTRRML